LLDEIIGRITIPHLPNKMGFTVNLNVNYRKYIQSNSFLLLESKLDTIKGRKAIGNGWIKDQYGDKLHADAQGTFVSPKYGLLAKISTYF
jgi:acyl-coenzyme A thioesterase PaaI-like protein